MAILQGILHVNLTIAPGEEALNEARRFYVGLLEMEDAGRPEETDSGTPGLWLWCGGGQQVHISAEADATKLNEASRRHPAFRVADLTVLHERLKAADVPLQYPKFTPAGIRRFFARDLWGNRLEFVEIDE
jgi:catechol 2,3-dioxygenase-like lactoylglutathione lyase family enzyme